jgi:osmotically-inducible protein OsmY
MANRRDNRFEEREHWRENPYRGREHDERQDYERTRFGQYNQPDYYGERRTGGRWEEPEWLRQRNEEQWGQRGDYGRYTGEHHYGQGYSSSAEQYRDRPYSGSTSYGGRGGFGGGYAEHEPYREGREGYGATSMGTGWGSVDTGRHRLGSLTDSAAESAQHIAAQRQRANYAGRGPKGYKRSDERIREDVSEVLTRNPDVDASNIEVAVNDGIVVLSGSVDDRHAKRIAEDITQDVSGVRDVQNQIRVQPASVVSGSTENKGPASETSRQGSVLGLSAEAGGRK